MKTEMNNEVNQTATANNDNISGNLPDVKDMYINPSEIRLKGMFEKEEMQRALLRCFPVPHIVTIKKLRNPYCCPSN